MTSVDLRPYQQVEFEFLSTHPRSANWAEAGLGKTRALLLAAEGKTLVIAPGAIRDTQVWPREAARIGVEPPEVISYHQAAKSIADYYPDTLILDESHNCKSRKVSWGDPIYALAHRTERVHQATGTPMPNTPHELWGQLRMLWGADERRARYYWPWLQNWFEPAPTKHDSYARGNRLLGCRCDESSITTCAHWQAFYQANIAGWAIRHLRSEVASDLPPLDGHEDPLWTPMPLEQRRAYKRLAKDMLADIPSQGLMIEALSSSGQFTMLHKLSSGLSILDPAADPHDKQSGKLTYVRERLKDADRPVLIVCWFKNSARALERVCADLGVASHTMGSSATGKQRLQIVDAFGAGSVPVLIASLGVIKEGVDGLQYGSDEVILFERSWVPGPNEQVIRRLHRLGQSRPVTARQLVTPQTVDHLQWRTVYEKAGEIGRVLRPAELAALVA